MYTSDWEDNAARNICTTGAELADKCRQLVHRTRARKQSISKTMAVNVSDEKNAPLNRGMLRL